MQTSMPERDWSELDDLVRHLIDGELSDEQRSRLADLLRGDRAAQRHYWLLTTLHSCLQVEHSISLAQLASEPVPRRLPPNALETPSAAIPAPPLGAARPFAVRVWTTPLGFSLLTATVGLISFMLTTAQIPLSVGGPSKGSASQPLPTGELTTFAQVGECRNCRWAADGSDWEFGTKLAVGQELQLQEGLAEIRLRNGTTLLLQGRTTVRLDSHRRIQLRAGRLVARVPFAARGFAVDTPSGSVVDLGTEFGVVVDDRQEVDVHVFQGAVQVYPKSGPESSRRAVGGQAVRITTRSDGGRPGARIQPIGLATEQFVRAVRGAAPQSASQESLEATLWQDAGLIVYYGASSAESSGVAKLHNLSRAGTQYDGRLTGGQWRSEEGNSRARVLHLEGPRDGVSFDISDELPALTLVTRVRIERKPQPGFIGLVLSDGWANPGQVHWQVIDDSRAMLAFSSFSTGARDVVLPHSQLFGRWVHLAVSYDPAQGRIAQYVDAQQVYEAHDLKLPPAKIGPACWGRWEAKGLNPTNSQRNLVGEVAELMIFRRALSRGEIDYLYRSGRNAPALSPAPDASRAFKTLTSSTEG